MPENMINMKKILTYIAAVATLLTISVPLLAQTKTDGTRTTVEGKAEFPEIVHDFGDVITGSGPLEHTFTVKNISQEAMVIYNVVASCGCTDVQWTREPLRPGATGKIRVTYKNEDGPFAFDKNLTVYLSGLKKPVVLRLRGVAHEKKVPLAEAFPVHIGNFALKESEIRCGNMSQGSQRSDAIWVANIGDKPIKVSFADVSAGMDIHVSPETIPAGSKAKMVYTITADKSHWGKNWYSATPVVNGRKQSGKFSIWAFTKEDFSGLSDEDRKNAPMPYFDESTYNFGIVKAGTQITASFPVRNIGKSDFVSHKADFDTQGAKVLSIPVVKAGGRGTYKISLDTTNMKKGETVVIVTLTTNAPSRPIANLFISGAIE